MLGLVVLVGVIVRFFTRARDRGMNRLVWVSVGIASYVVPYMLMHEAIGAFATDALGVSTDQPASYFVQLFVSIMAGLACSVVVMRRMIRGLRVIRES